MMRRPHPAEAATDIGHDAARERAEYSGLVVGLCAGALTVGACAWLAVRLVPFL